VEGCRVTGPAGTGGREAAMGETILSLKAAQPLER